MGGLLLMHLIIASPSSAVLAQTRDGTQDPAEDRRGFSVDSPHRLSLALDVPIVVASVGLMAAGFGWQARVDPLEATEVVSLDPADVNAFDRPATSRWNENVQIVSDVGAALAAALPAALYASPEVRRDGWRFTAMWAEVFLATEGITEFTKAAASRTRPYLYNDELTVEERTSGRLAAQGRVSFYSGHTSLSAAFCFYTAMIVETHHPRSAYSRLAWSGAAALPALIGTLRVVGGKHFPTDVMVGYAVGALIGVGVPLLHRIGPGEVELALSPFADRSSFGLTVSGRH